MEILGINGVNFAGFNSLVTSQRSLPWLQDTRQDNVWGRWNVRWRDVWIVDSLGQLKTVYNLTDYDLANPVNAAELLRLFLKEAKVVDSDGDRLPDDWELLHFGGLSSSGASDPDGDGFDNFTEYAFGTDPLDPKSHPSMSPRLLVNAAQPTLNLKFHRRAGNYLEYVIEKSPAFGLPFNSSPALTVRPSQDLFDGTGTIEAGFSAPLNALQEFFTLRALPRH